MNLGDLGRIIMVLGLSLVVLGAIVYVLGAGAKLPRLPGDIFIRRDNITLYVPIVTMILISVVATILLNLFFRR